MTQKQTWYKVAAAYVIQDGLNCGSPILENEEFLIEIAVCISVNITFQVNYSEQNKDL